MKEAIRVNISGLMVGITLVADDVTGVFPVYQTPTPTEEGETPEPVLTGYQVAAKPPAGLYKLKFDIATWLTWQNEEPDPEQPRDPANLWGEGLTPEELDEIQNRPVPETDAQKIARLEEEKDELQAQMAQINQNFMEFTDLYFSNNPEQA